MQKIIQESRVNQFLRQNKSLCFIFGILIFIGLAFAVTTITDLNVNSPTGTYVNISVEQVNNVKYVISGDATDLANKINNLTNNDTLIIPKGYYEITDCGFVLAKFTITEKDISIIGSGIGTKIHVNCNNETPTGKQVFRFTGENILIKDIYFQGNQTDVVAQNQFNKTSTMIGIMGADNVQLSNLWFLDGLEAIDISSSDNVQISDINVLNNEHFLLIQGSSKNININNVIVKQFARDGRSGYVQTGIKINNNAKNVNVNNFILIGYRREAFRIEGGRDLSFSNIYLEGNGNYSVNTPTTAGFNILNSSNIVINNFRSKNGKEDITIDQDNDNFDNLIVTNMFLENTTLGFTIPATSFNVSNVKISDSIILVSSLTGSNGIDIRKDNLTNVVFNNIQVSPTDLPNTNAKALNMPVSNLNGLSLINSKFHGTAGDIDVGGNTNIKIRIINSQFRDDDVRAKKFSNTTVWNFTEFTGNYFGTDDNPTYYGDVADDFTKINRQRAGSIAYDYSLNIPMYYNGTDWNNFTI